ncbi:hypothetical protein LEP1GSC193_2875 [Leptospira alstonii serovar Pingchang str. 80-412]|uniref:Uncharacterized protein n=2 Tax=Leptospira alstonii TaxID=28452 RepID=M6D0Y1_9LEPT|nr:hypothetical protein LEP1GSC194_3289 [Leptospira alstonii serovar Sichuan str. 79601]EQA81726.1 hypothetical protein LEP1GSC193_2875 [Leptospira alstonii serovar Pingchang str. 80-412]
MLVQLKRNDFGLKNFMIKAYDVLRPLSNKRDKKEFWFRSEIMIIGVVEEFYKSLS